MADFNFYDIVKITHIISLIAWFAGLFYLPRLFVYHCKAKKGGELDSTLMIMEQKLLRIIMNPAMILTIITGLYLAYEIGFNQGWLHAKLTFVAILVHYHHLLAKYRKNFTKGENKKTEKFYRILNEAPTVLLIAIVSLVILKPF